MQQIIYFFQKYKYFLFFLLLQFVAITLTINNNNFHKSKFISTTSGMTSVFYEKTSQLSDFFNLKYQNQELIVENTKLKNKLEHLLLNRDSTNTSQTIIDSTKHQQEYTYTQAKIINNVYNTLNNHIRIKGGKNQGINTEMAVINGKGIIGITDVSSDNYSRIQSILNSNSKINARLKNSFHFGTLTWNGKDYNTVQLEDIPRQATIKIGDTIITGGKSTIFPEGILIGAIIDINNSQNFINIRLFNDMSNLGYVYVVKNLHKIEIKSLEKTDE